MARFLCGFLLTVLVAGTSAQMSFLNPNFDYQTLGLQAVMTYWDKDESIHELVQVLQDQIPMNLSEPCRDAVHQWVFDLLKRESYAIAMADAAGKLPAGILLGHILVFGHFDQCMALKKLNNKTGVMESAANYCLTRLKHPLMEGKLPALPAFGVCLPHACANERDSNAFVTELFRVLRRAKELEAVQGICIKPLAKNAGFYIMASLIGLIIVTITAAAVVDCIYRRRYKESPNNLLHGSELNDVTVQIYGDSKTVNGNGLPVMTTQHTVVTQKPKYGYANVPACLKPLLCYNIMTNVRSVLSTRVEEEISFLHGFRVLSIWWIILGNTYFFGRNFFENSLSFFADIKTAKFQLILNSGYAVDGFLMVTGVLISYALFRELQKNNGKLNWLSVYFHRWWILTPVYMFVMLFYVYVLPHGIQSPFKLLIAQEGIPTDYCKSHWWTNMLYINNFIPFLKTRQCMNWTWLLALDMQFFLIAPLIIYVLYKNRIAGMAVIGALIVACVAATMSLIGYYGLPIHHWQDAVYNSTETGYDKNIDYINEKPYTRITPFVIGLALGYVFHIIPANKASNPNSRLMAAIGWTVSLVLAVPLLFGAHFAGWYVERPPQEMSVSSRIAYGGLQRLGWSLVIGWILFACQYGYGGPVRRFLASRFWRPLSSLTYGAYIVHMLTLQLHLASQIHMIYYSGLNMLCIFLAQLVLAYTVALLIAVLVEVPLLRLERLILRRAL
ncbi:putative Nose resistant to fluoxetine protein 6 [Hypsibius exemplaris]|uniref:Nose resistant to fluoxetine protein 6 n=1 Tax=Hypsibius exemplaris TaxID=2072580 RepID=A0A1W0X2H2_HYPEX|nr:putative Nose resistant to fluoxetine protein 6 [Hypsibius exemplaris]